MEIWPKKLNVPLVLSKSVNYLRIMRAQLGPTVKGHVNKELFVYRTFDRTKIYIIRQDLIQR